MTGGIAIAGLAVILAYLTGRVVSRIILPESRAKAAARDRAIANAMALYGDTYLPDELRRDNVKHGGGIAK